MNGLSRLWWSVIPIVCARVSTLLALMMADGVELCANPLVGALSIPAAILAGFVLSALSGAYDSAISGSLFTCCVLAIGITGAGPGIYAAVAFYANDLGHVSRSSLPGFPLVIVPRLDYAILIVTLAAGIPFLARLLARATSPGWTWLRIPFAALLCGAMTYAWTQSAAVLVRPLWGFNTPTPPVAEIRPVQQDGLAVAIFAVCAMLIAEIVRARFKRSAPVVERRRAIALALPKLPRLDVPVIARVLLRAFVAMSLCAPFITQFYEWPMFFGVYALGFALNAALGNVRWYANAVAHIPLILRYGVTCAAGIAISATVTPLLLPARTNRFLPVYAAIVLASLVGFLLFPAMRRASVAAVIVVAACAFMPHAALADNCSGLSDCFTTGQWAAIAAAAVLVLATGGFVLLLGAGAEAGAAFLAEDAALGGLEAAAGSLEAGGLEVAGAAEAEAAGAAEAEAAAAADAEAGAAAEAEAATPGSPFNLPEEPLPRFPLEDDPLPSFADPPPGTQAIPPEYNVAPDGGTTNCGPICDAMDDALAGNPFTPVAENATPGFPTSGTFQYGSSPGDIANAMANAGDGARGVVYVGDSTAAHVFNVVNNGGEIVAVDGQLGAYGSISDIAAGSGYQGSGLTWGFFPRSRKDGFIDMTMTRDDAAARAAAHLSTIANAYGSPYVLMLDAVREGERYWLFPYNTQRFAETLAPQDGAVGNGPILIDKSNGTVYQVPTGGRERWIAEFERTGVAPAKRA